MGTSSGIRRNTPNLVITPAVQGSDHTVYNLVWQQANGDIFDLTDATIITGTRTDTSRDDVYDLTGEFEVTHAVKGELTWRPSATDTSIAGNIHVQFIALFDDGTKEITYPAQWVVQPQAAVTAVGSPPLVGIPSDVAICVTSMCEGLKTAEEGAVYKSDGAGGGVWKITTLLNFYDYALSGGNPLSTGSVNVTPTGGLMLWDVSAVVGSGYTGWGLIQLFADATASPHEAVFSFWDRSDVPLPNFSNAHSTYFYPLPAGATLNQQLLVPIHNGNVVLLITGSVGLNVTYEMVLYSTSD